jgi:tetratricopeptide (TPR) repeat protein
MKKFLAILVLGIASMTAFAEASFDQIQMLIQQQNYSAAEKGLEEIIRNHPKSAKAFYAMAQAQAGLGNQEKAKKALDIATGLNPTLDFAPQSSVQSLREAITPQVEKIEAVEPSHFWRNFILGFLLFFVAGFGVWYAVQDMKRKAEKEAERQAREAEAEAGRQAAVARERERERQEEAEREALRQHPNYGNERFDPTNPDVLLPKKTKAQVKKEQEEALRVMAEQEARRQRLRAEAAEEEARQTRMRSYSAPSAPTTTVVNNSGNDMLTGVLIGNMLGSSHHHDHHETTRVVEREVIRETPKRDSSWDDTPTPSISTSRSSSWDDTPSSSSSRSSSWDDDSSSRSSSSWSSSSSSDSSSSWSDSSSSSSSSSSSWD